MRVPSVEGLIAFCVPVFLCLLATPVVQAQRGQGSWSEVDERSLDPQAERRIIPSTYRVMALDISSLTAALEDLPEPSADAQFLLEVPMPEGHMEGFMITEAPIMHPELATQFTEIRTYAGKSADRPGSTIRFDVTPFGFHAMVLDQDNDPVFIDPYAMGDRSTYISYRRSAFIKQTDNVGGYCSYDEVNDLDLAASQTAQWIGQMDQQRAGDCQLRIYRLALACTGEYANFHGSHTVNNNKSFAMAAMVTTMNRVNAIFERDATLAMQLVPGNDQLIFLDPATDPYSNQNASTMLGQNQTTCNSVIGIANYDIGHVFSTGGGGVAYLNSPCTTSKAGGVSGSSNPVGDPFDIDYVAHEMGHQFGANHTQNNNCNRMNFAAYEPGSASTIMGYAGICSPNVQSNSDALFHGFSMQEIAANITVGNSSTCPQTVSLINAPPSVSAGANHIIPHSTPFVLTASATDPDGDMLTYAWEQMNNQVSVQPPQPLSTAGPNFRAYLPSTTPARYFPNLTAVINNIMPTWEVLPSVGRTLNFRVTVRDNASGAGCNAQDNMVVTVASTAGPFVVTQPNTNVSWPAGSSQLVTWNVANTTASPVSCANVDILLSVDGGYTYPYTLASATPNDGGQQLTFPNIPATSTARVMVKGTGTIFFDISDQDFNLTSAPAEVLVNVKAILEGPFESATGLMNDHLRQAGLLPFSEPYTALGQNAVGNSGGENTSAAVMSVTGSNAIVDWVHIQLRSSINNGNVVATRNALLQRDGDIVDVDGIGPVTLPIGGGNYFLAVFHRNHLACMTASAITFSTSPITVDLRSGATATFGTDARKTIGSIRALWAGNVVNDDRLAYTGTNNDRDPILQVIGGVVPTASTTGYIPQDVNMDGVVKYTGANNDRDIIITNIGGVVPTNIRSVQLP